MLRRQVSELLLSSQERELCFERLHLGCVRLHTLVVVHAAATADTTGATKRGASL